jgi:hypothetical protein
MNFSDGSSVIIFYLKGFIRFKKFGRGVNFLVYSVTTSRMSKFKIVEGYRWNFRYNFKT